MIKCLPPEQGFLGIAAAQGATYDDAHAVIVPYGLEKSVSYGGGTAQGPAAIIKASHQVELFDEHFWCEPYEKFGIATLVAPTIAEEMTTALADLENIVDTLLTDHKFPMILGGEHTLTPGAIRPFIKKYPELILLHFDAHADLRDSYEGDHYSHAAAIRRCLDTPNLEVISIGIRNISAEEIPFLEKNRRRIHMHWAKDKKHWDIDNILAPLAGRPVYLTFDVDGFDASIMPATGTPEPGGLFWDDAIAFIEKAAIVGKIVGADINELAPIPGLHSCDFLAAKLAYRILSHALLPHLA